MKTVVVIIAIAQVIEFVLILSIARYLKVLRDSIIRILEDPQGKILKRMIDRLADAERERRAKESGGK